MSNKAQGHLYRTTVEVEYNGKKVRLTKKDAELLKQKVAAKKKADAEAKNS